jgi:catechol 2,3-dioxygenase-like lactoylglutathione lyase family enzyme
MKIKIKQLNHVTIVAPPGEEAKAREFYTGILQLKEIEQPESLKPSGGVWFQMSNVELHIAMEPAMPRSKRHPAFEVEGLADIKAYLQSQGVRIKEEVPIPGRNRFSFYDPFENRIELLEWL